MAFTNKMSHEFLTVSLDHEIAILVAISLRLLETTNKKDRKSGPQNQTRKYPLTKTGSVHNKINGHVNIAGNSFPYNDTDINKTCNAAHYLL